MSAAHVLVSEVSLRFPSSHSLKDRRRVVSSIVDRAHRQRGVAVSEVDGLDDPRRAVLAFVAVSGSPSRAEELIDASERFVWSRPDVEVGETHRNWLEVDR